MGRNKSKLILIFGFIALFVLLGVGLISRSTHHTKPVKPATVVVDKQTGASFYKNDPETNEKATGSNLAAIVGADTLINHVTNNQLIVVRRILTNYVRFHDNKTINLLKFYPSNFVVQNNGDITGIFSTDTGSMTYNVYFAIPSINNIEIKLSVSTTPNTVIYDSGYVDSSTANTSQSGTDD